MGVSASSPRRSDGLIPPHEMRGAGHLAFAISSDHIDGWGARLRERGIKIESEVQWEGGTSLYFRDPDANLLELATLRLSRPSRLDGKQVNSRKIVH